VISTLELPGKLILYSASLLFCAVREFLKWQTPVVAASELLAAFVLVLRARFSHGAPKPATR
jgi:hypothetical protein